MKSMYTKKWGSNILIQSTGGVIALSCWAPLHKQLPAQATPTNLEVPYLQVPTYIPRVFHLQESGYPPYHSCGFHTISAGLIPVSYELHTFIIVVSVPRRL